MASSALSVSRRRWGASSAGHDKSARLARVVAALIAVLVSLPPLVRADDRSQVPRVGLLHVGVDHVPSSLEGLREGLTTMGYENGKTIHLDWRNVANEPAGRAAVQDFLADRAVLIVAFENEAARLAKAATSEIPVVFVHAVDPAANGFVRALAHPDVTSRSGSASVGGNMTGFAGPEFEPAARQVHIFKGLMPALRRLLVVIQPADPRRTELLEAVRRKAGTLKLQLVEREANDQADLERIAGGVKRGSVDAILVVSPGLQAGLTPIFFRLALQRKLPTAGFRKDDLSQGAFFFYGRDTQSIGRTAARYVDKILKGTPPGSLPVEFPQPELGINLKTAGLLGLKVPRSEIVRATHVLR